MTAKRKFGWGAALLLLLAACFVYYLVTGMRSAGTIMRVLGQSGVEAFSRLMGFLLVCIGMQFVVNGIYEIAKDLHALLA